MNRDAVISKFLNGNGLEKFTAANQVIKKVNALTSHLQRQQISAETIRVDTQNTQAEKKLVPQIMKTRSGITLTNRHPGIADNGEGCFLMVYIEFFENNTRLVICGSNDYGANWGEPVYFGGPEPNNIPAMPSVAYWGKNGTVDRWYITYVDNSIPCGELHIIEVGTDTVTIVDLINAEFESVYWPSPGFCDPREPQIACDSRYGGFPISLSVDISGYNNAPALIYPGGLLGYYSLNNVLGNDISIDAAGHKVFAVWDPIYSTHGHGFLVSWENVTNHNDPSNEVYIWCADDGYQFFYPAGKAYNNHIIMAVEAKNMTAGTPEELDIVKFMDGTTGEIANETSWSWAGSNSKISPST